MCPGSSRKQYRQYVRQQVILKCMASLSASSPNDTYSSGIMILRGGVGSDLRDGISYTLRWHSYILQRSLCRLRAGIFCFGHLDGRRSSAKRLRCIFCNMSTLSPLFHVLGRCSHWESLRDLCWNLNRQPKPEAIRDQLTCLFVSGPGHEVYGASLAWAGSLDKEEKEFWSGAV
jgi:hypothetical protein